MLFSLVSSIIMGTYSFKGSVFLITGYPTTSSANMTIAEAFVRVTGGELAMAVLLVLAGTLISLLAKALKRHNHHQHQQFIDEVPLTITPISTAETNENQPIVYLRRCGDGERERTHLDE